ncbi:MAG TPA: nuclear transport factor 2 family protein [Lysobacter sp.]|nr:nuclear transport factor 2 family protein [Lysobacter sp.]
MKIATVSLAVALALACAATATAQTPPADQHAHHPAPLADAAAIDISEEAAPAVAIADQFGQALAAGDFETVETLLAPDVLILESGGAERSREEYLSHHAISDAKFLKDAHHQLLRRRAQVAGDLVWIGSESELHTTKDGKPLTLLSTETMVLRNTPDGWRIAHIHWSSRPKR